MAKETTVFKESKARPLNATGTARRASKKVPKSDRGFYDDSYVKVYNDKGKVVESGLWDYSAYRDEPTKWNNADGNYDLPHGYKLVIKN